MKRSNTYTRGSLVPTLGFIALFLFGLNFYTALSRNWDDWKMYRPKCWTAEARPAHFRFHHTIDSDRIEREVARSKREMARVEREMARYERKLRRLEPGLAPPPPPPAPPQPPQVIILR